jgi:predicted DNA binding CopG/RHH family protein
MTVKTKYANEPLADYRVVSDFLPAPDQLVFRDEGVKVTIALSKRSVEFFKSHAARNQTQYQRMIRQLLDAYVDAHAQPQAKRSTASTRRKVAR